MAEIVDFEKYRKSLKRKESARVAEQGGSRREADKDSEVQDAPGQTQPKSSPDGKQRDPDNKGV